MAPGRPADPGTSVKARPAARRGIWLPNQHGAWAMLLAPLGCGIVLSGPSLAHAALAGCWLIGYFAFFAAGQWLRSRRKSRYLPPIAVYGAISAACGIATLALHPAVAWWALAFAPLCLTSLWCSYRRKDRSLLNDTVTVLAACLACLTATAIGSAPDWRVSIPVALALFGYFEGTVFYVKTMIRERGSAAWYRLSAGYHAAYLAAAVACRSWLLAGFAAITLARAVVLPNRRLTPKQVGFIEVALTCALVALALTGAISS